MLIGLSLKNLLYLYKKNVIKVKFNAWIPKLLEEMRSSIMPLKQLIHMAFPNVELSIKIIKKGMYALIFRWGHIVPIKIEAIMLWNRKNNIVNLLVDWDFFCTITTLF